MMPTGKVKFYNEEKGYGFIVQDDGPPDMFVHATALPPGVESLQADDVVEYQIVTNSRSGKPAAADVRLLGAQVTAK